MSIVPPVQTHGHYSPQSDAARRVTCPGCGRPTAVLKVTGYLASHDRFNLTTAVRELCPGWGWMPDTNQWAWFARKAW